MTIGTQERRARLEDAEAAVLNSQRIIGLLRAREYIELAEYACMQMDVAGWLTVHEDELVAAGVIPADPVRTPHTGSVPGGTDNGSAQEPDAGGTDAHSGRWADADCVDLFADAAAALWCFAPDTPVWEVLCARGTEEITLTAIGAMLDCGLHRSQTVMTASIAAVIGLPQVMTKALDGHISFERLEHTARAARLLSIRQLAAVDELVAGIDPDASMKTVRGEIEDLITAFRDDTGADRSIEENRRVDIEDLAPGFSLLTLSGPSAELHALFERARATAKAIRKGSLSLLNPELKDQPVDDDRTQAQLMFDLLCATRPTTYAEVADAAPAPGTGADAGAGAAETAAEATDSADESAAAAASHSRPAADVDGGDADDRDADDPEADDAFGTRRLYELRCPTSTQWLRAQCGIQVTVPVLSLLGQADLPGSLNNVTPIPADTARRLAQHGSVFYRLLTDPTTGEILDEAARLYHIPAALRTTINAAWIRCTYPGCEKAARSCDIDHIDPFDHSAPGRGGPTAASNLHPLCRHHHNLKTNGVIRIERDADGMLRWKIPVDACVARQADPAYRTYSAARPRSHINVVQADLFEHPDADRLPDAPPDTVHTHADMHERTEHLRTLRDPYRRRHLRIDPIDPADLPLPEGAVFPHPAKSPPPAAAADDASRINLPETAPEAPEGPVPEAPAEDVPEAVPEVPEGPTPEVPAGFVLEAPVTDAAVAETAEETAEETSEADDPSGPAPIVRWRQAVLDAIPGLSRRLWKGTPPTVKPEGIAEADLAAQADSLKDVPGTAGDAVIQPPAKDDGSSAGASSTGPTGSVAQTFYHAEDDPPPF